MPLTEFDHFFQEAYPVDLKKHRQKKDAIKKSGDMTIIKKIVRACTDNNGHTHLPKISKGNFNRLGVPVHIKEMNPDEYQMAYDYIKPIFDELRDPQQIHPDNFRSLKKKLFDLTGVGRPESHVITIIDKPLPGSVSFNIIKKKQNSLYKRTNKTKFVHFSNSANLSALQPTGSSKVFNGHKYLYPNFRCYFWAIETESIPEYMIDYAHEVYGKHIYQYTPKASDKIVVDMSESKRFPGCTPVFIETDKSLSIKDITNDININNTDDVSHTVDNDTKGETTSGKQSIIQDENSKVLKEFKSIEYAVMHVLNNFIHMKESTKDAAKYRKLYNKIEENIEFDSDLITSEKTKCAKHYPNAKNISLFDDLLKRYTKKVNAVLTELENLIKKSNVVKESYYGPNDDGTSGTSEFDESYDNDPNDCYCELVSPVTKELSDTEESVKCVMSLSEIPVTYDDAPINEWRLKTPEQVISSKKGNCHDTAWYIYNKLDEFAGHKVDKGILFFIETNGQQGGVTHSICYEVIPDGVVQIEYSWDTFRGTEPRNDITEIIENVKRNWKFTNGFNQLMWFHVKNTSNIHPGMTLQEYVNACVTDGVTERQESYNGSKSDIIHEAAMTSKQRNKLDDSDFALVYTDANGKKLRKYPIHDEAHCKAAAHMFPRGVPLKYQSKVARKILQRAHEFGIDTSGWKNLNKFK